MDYRVELVTTRPHFGGVRWWFVCPLSGRRARKLYLLSGCDYFASRQALGLKYQSCRETVADRELRKFQKDPPPPADRPAQRILARQLAALAPLGTPPTER